MHCKKVPFIEHKDKLDKNLSKLFNIVINFYGLNDPLKVGYCVRFYSEYFKKNGLKNVNSPEESLKYFNEVKNSYLNHKQNLRTILPSNQREAAFKSVELLKNVQKYLDKNSKEYQEIDLNFPNINDRGNQLRSDLFKVIAIFKTNQYDKHDKVYDKIKIWTDEINNSFSVIEIREKAKIYLMDLVTIDSMIGTVIENDILEYFSEKYPVYKTNTRLEKLEIDGFINGSRCSVKPLSYKNSPYKKNAKTQIESVLNGAPIIYYSVNENEYLIDNLEAVENFYKIKGSIPSVLDEIKEVSNLKVAKNNF